MSHLLFKIIIPIIYTYCFATGIHEKCSNTILDIMKSCNYECVQIISEDSQLALRILKKVSMNYNYVALNYNTSLPIHGCERLLLATTLNFPNYWIIESKFLMERCSPGTIWLFLLAKGIIMEDFFKNITIPLECDILVAQTEDGYVLSTEVYRVSPIFPIKTYKLGNWTSNNTMCSEERLHNRREMLQGLVLRTAIKEEFFNKDLYPDGLGRNYIFGQVWLILTKYLNFTPEYRYSYDFGNGIVDEDDSWTGIVGMLQNSEVDITAEGISMTKSRLSVVDYISPIWSERKYPFMRATKIFKTSWKNFINPFDSKLWFFTIAIMLVISTGFFAIHLFKFFSKSHKHEINLIFLFSQCLFRVFGSFLNQVQTYETLSFSTRILKLASYWSSIIILASYSASFYSFLTLRNPAIPFSAFEELLEDGTYELGVLRYSSLLTFFQDTEDPVLKEIYQKIIVPNNRSLPTSSLEGLQRACSNPKYAHMHSLEGVTKYTEKLKCQIMLAPRAKIETLKSMATVKGSPYLGLFKYTIYKMQEGGIIQKLNQKAMIELSEIEEPAGIMDVKSVMPVIWILVLGTTLSIFFLILETFFRRLKCYKAIC